MRPLLFSIITPTHNYLEGLRRTFDSVRTQSADLFEYIVIDGASTDGTPDWLRQKADGTCRWISEPDTGVYDAMNKGLGMAGGQFLYFLGAGDELQPDILSAAKHLISKLPARQPRFIYGDVRRMDEGGRIAGGRFTRSKLCVTNISHQAIFYERSIFELLGLYDLKYSVYSDWVFNFRCFGDRRIAKHRWNRVIADFEGNGLSDRVPDVPFAVERVDLIRRYLGPLTALRFQFKQKLKRLRNRLFARDSLS